MKYVDVTIWDDDKSRWIPRVVKNGDTTIAFGYGVYDEQLENKIGKLVETFDNSYKDATFFGNTKEYKGVAKLCPGDVYDEKRGIKIASKKAEYKARKAAYRRYNAILKQMNSLSIEITEEMNKLLKRMNALEEDFKEELAK